MADAAFRLGDWEAAKAAALQTFQLAEEVGHRHMAGWALTAMRSCTAPSGSSSSSLLSARGRSRYRGPRRQYMHQHPLDAPDLPNRSSSAGHCADVSGLIVKSILDINGSEPPRSPAPQGFDVR